MASYNSIVLTTAGTQMLKSAISSGTKITFTKAQTSQTQYSQIQLTNLAALSPTAQETVDLKYSNANSKQTKISITFTNKEVTTAYNANTVALFASNGTNEVLFAVATAKIAESVPAFDGTQAQSMVIDFYLELNAENAIIEVTNSGMATSQELTDAQSQLNNQISTVDKNAVHLAGNETIVGAKNFTGNLQKNGVDVATIDDVLSRQYVKMDANGKAKIGDDFIVLVKSPSAPTITIDESANYVIVPTESDPIDVIAPVSKYKIYYKINNVDYTETVNSDVLTGKLAATNLPTQDGIYPLSYSATSINAYAESTKSSTKSVNYTPKDTNVYGVSWDLSSSPTLTRTDSAVGLVAGINGAQNDFDSKSVWKGITTVTDSLNNVFIRIPKFYIKKTQTSTLATWQVSLASHGSDWYLPACFCDFSNSVELPYVDISKYEGSISNGVLKSVSGVQPTVSQPIAQFRAAAVANGTGYQLWDIHANDALRTLFFVEFATLNTQSIMAGNTNSSAALSTGATDSISGTSGTSSSSAMSYRGVENLYGNIWKWCDGANFTNNVAYVCKDASKYQSDVFASPYQKVGYSLIGSSDFVKSMGYDSILPFAQFATSGGGSETTYYSDKNYMSTSNTVLLSGGGCHNGGNAGVSYLDWGNSSSVSDSSVGSRLIKKAS